MATPPAPLRQILVGTDFSPAAAAGVAWAIDLARAHGARLRLLHALLLRGPATDFLVSPPDLSEQIQASALAKLEEAAAEIREQGVEVEPILRMGPASQSLLEAAEDFQPDLIVLGTRGSTGLEHLLLGSTAERVVLRARAPVLTVHPQQAATHRPVRTVLVPTDFSHDAELATTRALSLIDPASRDARLVLLHAYHLPIEFTAYGTIPTSPRYLEDAAGAAEAKLALLAEALQREGLEVETLAREGYPPEVILAEAKRLGADLIALGTHGRSGLEHLLLGSNSVRVVQRAPCPVLTVRREAH